MSAEALLLGLGASALELAPSLFEAIAAGNRQEARDIAEEMARREAFEARQSAKARKRGGK